jgi:2-C-methyl-D-erythritol 4-phosphate cytidylyltransferase
MRTFASMPEIAYAVVVTEPESAGALDALAKRTFTVPVATTGGGATRQESVANGLAALHADCDRVLVHDGARPLVRADDVRAGMIHVRSGDAAVLAVQVTDTIKCVDPASMTVVRTLDREILWAAQTPQFATRDDLLRAHADAAVRGIVATDDVALLERIGVRVTVVPASTENFKVTVPDDVARAEALLRQCV